MDQESLDTKLPMAVNGWMHCAFQVGGALVLVSIIMPLFIVALIPIAISLYYLQQYYTRAARDIKALDSVSRSPLYASFGEMVAGCSTIRAFQLQSTFLTDFHNAIDAVNVCWAATCAANRWLGLRVECLGAAVAGISSLSCVMARLIHGSSNSHTLNSIFSNNTCT